MPAPFVKHPIQNIVRNALNHHALGQIVSRIRIRGLWRLGNGLFLQVLLHKTPGGFVVEFVAAFEDEVFETVGQAEFFVVDGGEGGQGFAAVAVIDAVFAAGLDLQRSRADQGGEVGIAEEGEAVGEFEVGGDREFVALVAGFLHAVVTTAHGDFDPRVEGRGDERVVAAVRQADHRDSRGIDFRPLQQHVQAAGDFGDLHRRQARADEPHPLIDLPADVFGKTFRVEQMLRREHHVAQLLRN